MRVREVIAEAKREAKKEVKRKLQREYYQKHKEQIKDKNKAYNERNKEKVRVRQTEWRHTHPELIKGQGDRYRKNHKEQIALYQKRYHLEKKVEVLSYYGGGKCACVLCGETDIRCLSIDHVDGSGAAHRKKTRRSIYLWLRSHGYPIGYRTLCMNCQWKVKLGD